MMGDWKLFIITWIIGQVSAQLNEIGDCEVLSDPAGSHPRFGEEMKAGSLAISVEYGELVVRTLCDTEKGFTLLDERYREMRCMYDEDSGDWHWNHYPRDTSTPPQIRCAHVSPKPIKQQLKLSAELKGCPERETLESSVRDELRLHLPCARVQECAISNISCGITESGTVLFVTVASTALKNFTEQRLILEEASEFFQSNVLDMMTPSPHTHGRIKRFDPSDFDDAETEDVVTTGCPDGLIVNSDDSCTECTAGTYANTDADPETCSECGYDTYSTDRATECTECGSGLGTLERGSEGPEDCIAICSVPTVEFATGAESRVAEGGNVEITCEAGYTYGNVATSTIPCSSSTNDFPSSCRKVTISADKSSVKSGDSVHLTCAVEASDTGVSILWFKGDSTTPLNSDDSSYTIATALAVEFESDGKTKLSTSNLTIFNFDSADVASYSCRVDYTDPILGDESAEQDLAILGLVLNASSPGVLYEVGESLELSCAMNLDEIYSTRSVKWKLDGGYDLVSGITTSTSDSAYTSVLSFPSLALSDAGTYTCIATYSLSDGSDPVTLSETIDVALREFETHPADKNVTQGSQVEISCIVVGDKKANITWIKDSQPVVGDQDIYNEADNETKSTLTIASATAQDAGVYECVADFGDGSTVLSNPAIISVNEHDDTPTATPKDTPASKDMSDETLNENTSDRDEEENSGDSSSQAKFLVATSLVLAIHCF